jgi:undecaprenyl-diphosphatase
LLLSALPAGAVYLGLKGPLDRFCADQHALAVKSAWLLVVSGLLVISLRWARVAERTVGVGRALGMGCAQALAILPGISRSGATITLARHLGVAPEKAAEFSLLMSVPVIAAATLLDLREHVSSGSAPPVGHGLLLLGIGVAAVVGYLAILILVRMLSAGRIWLFGFYTLAAAAIALMLL